MQKIETFIRASSTNGRLVDSFNTATSRKVSILRGMQAELIIQLFKTSESSDDAAKYTAADFSGFTSWIMHADVDYNQETALKLLVPTEDIIIGEDGRIHIQILSTNTETLATAIGSTPSIDLICELLGYEVDATVPSFALQFPITILNRVGLEGAETPIPPYGIASALADLFTDVADLPENASFSEVATALRTALSKLKGN